jgi:hypothetical protein
MCQLARPVQRRSSSDDLLHQPELLRAIGVNTYPGLEEI